MRRASLLLAAAAAPLLLAAPANAATRLNATVGPGATITLKTVAGKKVTRLKAGAYTIRIVDRADDHNFHLRGPGVNRTTSVAFMGTRTITVRLRRGLYRYVCDPHAQFMKGSFRVT